MKKKRQSCVRFLLKPTNSVNQFVLVAFVILSTTVISSDAQQSFREYGSYQYFDAILDNSNQDEPQFSDIDQPGTKKLYCEEFFI